MRTGPLSGIIPGLVLAVLPSAGLAIVVSAVTVIFGMLLCRPDKGGWNVPAWVYDAQAIAIFVAGSFGAILAQHPRRDSEHFGRIIGSAIIGAVVGAVAFVYTGFDGYFVLKSNARPIGQAVIGFAVGGIAVLLWRLLITKLHRSTTETGENTGPII
jgi:hypothetical protein